VSRTLSFSQSFSQSFAKPLAVIAALSIPVLAHAHGPTPQKVDEEITIAASPEKVWGIVGDFGAIAAWHQDVKEAKATGGNEAGQAERELMLANGERIKEGLDEYLAEQRMLGYRLARENHAALPVSFYSATMEVVDDGKGGSIVRWSGRFYRADTGNFPPEHLNDAAAVAAMTGFFRNGLESLRTVAEKSP
jgi:mxaD protein